jgi:hypothetical protein
MNAVSTARVSQINGSSLYITKDAHSRPYYGYDARNNPTFLNAVRNKYVDVSGLLIPNKLLSKN